MHRMNRFSTNRRAITCAAALALATTGCGDSRPAGGAPDREGPPRVYTDSYPLAYMTARIGSDHITVHLPVSEGVNPALWRPDDAAIRRYQQADLILLQGAGYARWVQTATLPPARTVDTAAAFSEHIMQVPDARVHSHGDGPPHAHAGPASNTWLDPTMALRHARVVERTLSRRFPDAAPAFADGLAQLEAELAALDAALVTALAPAKSVPLLASWPVYHYLEARFDLALEHLHWMPGRMPAAEAWAALDDRLEAHPAQHMLWPVEPVRPIVDALATRGIAVVVVDLADRPSPEGDFLAILSANAGRLAAAFAGAGKGEREAHR